MSNPYDNNDQIHEQDAFGDQIDTDNDMATDSYDFEQGFDSQGFDPDVGSMAGDVIDHDEHHANMANQESEQSAGKKPGSGMLKKVAIIGGFGVMGAAASLFLLNPFGGAPASASLANLPANGAQAGAGQALEQVQYQDMMQRQQQANANMQLEMEAQIQQQMAGTSVGQVMPQQPWEQSSPNPNATHNAAGMNNQAGNPAPVANDGYRLTLGDESDDMADTSLQPVADQHMNILQAALTKMTTAVESNTQAVSEIRDLVVKQDDTIKEQREYIDRRFASIEDDISKLLSPGTATQKRAARSMAPALKVEATEGTKIYTLQKGQYLTGVAQMYGISRDEILRLNPQISNPSLVYVGQQIRIPVDAQADASYRFVLTEKRSKSVQPVTAEPTNDLGKWKLVAMSTEKAVLRDDQGRFYPVHIGTNVAGLGTIEAIDDRTATVTTTSGVIK